MTYQKIDNENMYGAIYDFSDHPNENESFTIADFRLYVPENTDTIRGIYIYMNGFGGDSRSIVQDSTMRALVEDINFSWVTEIWAGHINNGKACYKSMKLLEPYKNYI